MRISNSKFKKLLITFNMMLILIDSKKLLLTTKLILMRLKEERLLLKISLKLWLEEITKLLGMILGHISNTYMTIS